MVPPSRVIAALLLLTPVLGYKVLFIPAAANSHMVLLSSAAEAWVKAGHEAHVVKHHSVPVPTQYKDSGIYFLDHGEQGEVHYTQTDEFTKTVGQLYKKSTAEMPKILFTMFSEICNVLMKDEILFHRLKRENYDIAVVDIMPGPVACLHAVPYRLEIPFISLGILPPDDMLSHTLQTIHLIPCLPVLHAPEPSLLHRLTQLVAMQAINSGIRWYVDSTNVVNYLKDSKSIANLQDIRKQSKVFLIDREPMLEAIPQSPQNIIYIGGISASAVKPLPVDLKKFADFATEGLVIVSFGGSLTTDFPDEMQRKLLAGLSMLKQKVIIRLKTKPDYRIGSNIMITKWLPQNDLLGHTNTVLFVTHCGISSVREGVHRGVPMLGFPNQDEQRINAMRFRDHNYGLIMNRDNFTSEELKATVDKIIMDKTIKAAVKRAADIIKSRKFTGGQEVAYWIEHVIKFGGDHLIPYTSKLAWYEVMMYDIVLVILIVILVVFFVTIKCCQCVKRCCCGKGKPKVKTS